MELTKDYQFVSNDEFDTCANYARLNNGQVEVETLFRYGKPEKRMMSIEHFEMIIKLGIQDEVRYL